MKYSFIIFDGSQFTLNGRVWWMVVEKYVCGDGWMMRLKNWILFCLYWIALTCNNWIHNSTLHSHPKFKNNTSSTTLLLNYYYIKRINEKLCFDMFRPCLHFSFHLLNYCFFLCLHYSLCFNVCVEFRSCQTWKKSPESWRCQILLRATWTYLMQSLKE